MYIKTHLRSLYDRREGFDELYPFESTAMKLEYFVFHEVHSGKKTLNPHLFSELFDMDLGKVFVLFLAISSVNDNRLLTLKYKYTCPNGTENWIEESELENFSCTDECGCNEKNDLTEIVFLEDSDVPIYFELDGHLISYTLSYKKDNK